MWTACGMCGCQSDDNCWSCCDVAAEEFDEGSYCDGCAIEKIKKTKCDRCDREFCFDHGRYHKCCGLNICGDDYACAEKHETKTNKKCGHKTCTFHKGCRTCKLQKEKIKEDVLKVEDKNLVQDMLKKVKSKELKSSLREWMKSLPKKKKTGAKKTMAKKNVCSKASRKNARVTKK
ncbi:expressed unknown protein [Seminavis robusta]|uniref:Uncharacterized protein n=1 Tax=Seminavis robusta TaxID=568900 RepID=A0A9N8F4Y1_9STRA|nr:expressed unknown protein [Seminavis robusta]|eukprot:Sro3962_g352230.1 n/a (176) ;mRNA; r:1953-2480